MQYRSMANPYRILSFGLLAAFGVLFGAHLVRNPRAQTPAPPPPLLAVAHAAPVERVHRAELRRGETLSGLMRRMELDAAQARELLSHLAGARDPRTLRPGMAVEWRTYVRTGALRRLTMRLDADRTLRVDGRGGGLKAAVEEVEVRADTAVLAGTVRRSLYQAVLDGDGDVPRAERERVVDVLADRIFAYKIDFSRDLQPGDGYRILTERMVRPDGTARTSRILAVQFDVGGGRQEAYLFGRDGEEDYYDRDGESMKRAFLRAPLEFRRISSAFSTGRFHPILRRMRAHHGIDYAAAPGTPIRAVGDGVVRKAGWGGGYGNVVEITHQRGYGSRYAHMRAFARGIRPGARVQAGQVIGYVGSTGLSTGPHLHYEFHMAGRPVNPASIRHLTGEPVPSGSRSRFRALVEARLAAMDRAAGPLLAVRAPASTGN
ncbi:MAG TPA: peptidoglycan DD-metalloendopeptidase family protein [Longimicrobiaceae bacterium]|nr:peptidoglycan DD-metalloendopeptidase family protein [Longimicrobiaceae bacterium]